MHQAEKLIGKTVVSSRFGIGRVVDIENIGNQQGAFLVVEDFNGTSRNFVSVNDSKSMREISTLIQFQEFVDSLGELCDALDFGSKRERIEYFKKISKSIHLSDIKNTLGNLRELEDRSSVEEQIYNRLIDTLANEYSLLAEVEFSSAQQVISGKLGG